MVSFNASNLSEGTEYYDIEIENEPLLTEKGFTKFSLPTNGNATQMILYNDKDAELVTYIKFNKHNNIDAAVELLTDKLLAESKVSLEVLDVIRRYFRSACVSLAEDPHIGFFKNGKTNGDAKKHTDREELEHEQDSKVKPKQYTVFKYSKDGPLAEEITIHGLNKFLRIVDNKPQILDNIDLTEHGKNIILKPHDLATGSPTFPYEFANTEEIQFFIEQAQKETIDSLFLKHKSIWNKIVYADKKLIGVLAVDSLYSYFQDKFSTTHYEIFVGPPESGKGAILLGFKYLGYRVVVASDMSGANLLDLLGSIESCQITLAEDELDDIYDDPDKLRITKVGYDNVEAVPRTLDGNTTNRNAYFYYPYCFKIYATEDSPDNKKLEGFKDRTFEHHTRAGKPSIYAKRLSERTDSQNYKQVKSRIDYLRKLTLVYRLLHHADIVEEVYTNLQNRALELTEPQLRLFDSDKLASADKTVLKTEVIPVLSYCLRERKILAKKTLEAAIHKALESLLAEPTVEIKIVLDAGDSSGSGTAFKLLPNGQIYNKVKELADGTPNIGEDGKEHSFYSPDYGKVSDKRIFKICRDKFGGKDDTAGRDNAKTGALLFDETIVSSVGQTFNASTEIEIYPKRTDNQEQSTLFDSDDESGIWNDYLGLGIEEFTSQLGEQMSRSASFPGNRNDNEITQAQARRSHANNEKVPLSPKNTPISTSPPPNDGKKEQEESSIAIVEHSLYWSGSNWACHNCKLWGDKFTMQNISCNENKKK